MIGLEIDSKLSFKAHVEKICKKLALRIAVLRKMRAFLPLIQRVEYYNPVIRPVMSYASVFWSSCDKERLYRVLKLQKRAARVILYADRQASSVALFNKFSWSPFYEQSRIDKFSIIYKRINWTLRSYFNDHIIINNNRYVPSTAEKPRADELFQYLRQTMEQFHWRKMSTHAPRRKSRGRIPAKSLA